MNKQVSIQKTAAGAFQPVLYWGVGMDLDREAYWISFDSISVAERVGRRWADEQGAAFVPYKEIDVEAVRAETRLIKQYRDEGMDLRNAIRRARGQPYTS